VFNFWFAATVTAYVFFPDDGECEKQLYEKDCVDYTHKHMPTKTSFFANEIASNLGFASGSFMDACEWRGSNYNCTFHRPALSLLSIAELLLLAALIAVPLHLLLDVLLYGLVGVQQRLYDNKAVLKNRHLHNTQTASLVPAPTMRSMVFRAARLEHSRRTVDFLLANEEAEGIKEKIDTDASNFHRFTYSLHNVHYSGVNSLTSFFTSNNATAIEVSPKALPSVKKLH
jgi:hypothetical protein